MSGSAPNRFLQPCDRQQAPGIRPDRLKLKDVCSGPAIRDRGIVLKTGRPIQFEIMRSRGSWSNGGWQYSRQAVATSFEADRLEGPVELNAHFGPVGLSAKSKVLVM